MFIEQLMRLQLNTNVLRILKLVATQLNFLKSIVSDVLDLNMIKNDTYESILEKFNPQAILEFVVAIFEP